MSRAFASTETNCMYCQKGLDKKGHNVICEKHLCDFCGVCEGILFSFGYDLDFDLCSECLLNLQIQLQKGLIRIDQTKKDWNPKVPEEIVTIRKTLTEAERKEIFDRDNWKCVLCGSSEYLQIDHKLPFARGGTTEKHNLQTLCKKCNMKKRDSIQRNYAVL